MIPLASICVASVRAVRVQPGVEQRISTVRLNRDWSVGMHKV
jgi:hypothetical protein